MELEWLGKYRKLVNSLIRFSNNYALTLNKELMGEEVKYSFVQIQVIEYLIENEDHVFNMSEIAKALGISSSSFTKLTKKLADKGLLQKYHVKGNKKDIIIQATPFGRNIYNEYTERYAKRIFQEMFEIGDNLKDSELNMFTQMIDSLYERVIWKDGEPIILVAID